MPDRTWKRVERRVASLLGGQRVPLSGRAPSLKGDVRVDDWLVVEVKHRQRLPRWLMEALAGVREAAGPGRLGIVVLHERGRRHALVLASLRDFRDWFGAPREESDEGEGDGGD